MAPLSVSKIGMPFCEVHREFVEKGLISRRVKVIHLLLMNSQGRIYLQKRSYLKSENSNLYDKTIGGHVSAGTTPELTVVKECPESFASTAVVS